jgi:uncharacterized protein (DUF433 family)
MCENDSEKGERDMLPTAPKLDYPYITSNPDIAGGRPVIAGTRITVNCIAAYYQLGMSVDEILDSLRHLTPSQIHSALAYYFDHMDEINAELEEAGNSEYWKSQVQTHPALQ